MHLKQPLLDARVNAGGDEALDLRALACKVVLVVAVTIVGGGAAGVQRWGGLVLHGVLGAGEDVAPQELAFSQEFI